MVAPKPRNPLARFFDKVPNRPPHGCWLWQGSTQHDHRYGVFTLPGRRVVYAHRWIYETLVAPIPLGFEVDHLCSEKLCVNPEHLEAVTRKENARRAQITRQRNDRQWFVTAIVDK